FHIHIIPRKRGDDIDAWPTFDGANHDIKELFQKLRIR
ncbi:MAG: HIT family protein, partial [Ruminococcaceae bacterium]|nr:HIT family protein [Oscillospiraceae bacterium]